MRLELLTRPECHLCDEAAALLGAAGVAYDVVNIEDSVLLLRDYGVRIPVVRAADGRELGWPFEAGSLAEFMTRPA